MRDKPGLTYLEVGVYEGRSFFWVLDNILTHPSSKAVAVDIFEKDLEQRDVFLALFWDEVGVLVNGYQLIVRKAETGCDHSAGSVKRLDETLFCSRLGPFVYYWKPRKLYDPSTKRELVLREGDRPSY